MEGKKEVLKMDHGATRSQTAACQIYHTLANNRVMSKSRE